MDAALLALTSREGYVHSAASSVRGRTHLDVPSDMGNGLRP